MNTFPAILSPPEKVAMRKLVCRACEHVRFVGVGSFQVMVCGVCKCPETKLRFLHAKCPLGKW